jgi:hypothetical protein
MGRIKKGEIVEAVGQHLFLVGFVHNLEIEIMEKCWCGVKVSARSCFCIFSG